MSSLPRLPHQEASEAILFLSETSTIIEIPTSSLSPQKHAKPYTSPQKTPVSFLLPSEKPKFSWEDRQSRVTQSTSAEGLSLWPVRTMPFYAILNHLCSVITQTSAHLATGLSGESLPPGLHRSLRSIRSNPSPTSQRGDRVALLEVTILVSEETLNLGLS